MLEVPAPHPSVSRETQERLGVFSDLLRRWNATINLLGRGEDGRLVERHIADSLALSPMLGPTGAVADVGTGAGFPGLILSIAQNRPIVLVESDARKAAFLREAARVTQAPAEVLNARFETVHQTFDLIMARAVAPLSRLLPLVAPRLRPGGAGLFPKGRKYGAEMADASIAWHFQVTLHPSRTSPEARILVLSDIRPRQA